MNEANETNKASENDILITVKEAQQATGEPGFSVEFHNETVGMALLLDLGAYFTGLVRGQAIRTRPQEAQVSEPAQEQDGQDKKKARVKKPAVRR